MKGEKERQDPIRMLGQIPKPYSKFEAAFRVPSFDRVSISFLGSSDSLDLKISPRTYLSRYTGCATSNWTTF